MWILRLEEPEEQQKAQTASIIKEEKNEKARKMLMWSVATTGKSLRLRAGNLEHDALKARAARKVGRGRKTCARRKSLGEDKTPGRLDRLHFPWPLTVTAK